MEYWQKNYDDVDFEILKGKEIFKIVVNKNSDKILFFVSPLEIYLMYHDQDCCESVVIEDICGDIDDLTDSPILKAEKRTNSKEHPQAIVKEFEDHFTWTFYELATIKGSVTMRWYGESNGYYSEEVSFVKVQEHSNV